jgi:hypothetical protein
MTNDLQIGSFGLSVILSLVLRMIYGTWEIDNRYKPWIAVGAGMVLAFVAMYTAGVACEAKAIVSYCTQGFMTGATATGIYEMTKKPEPVTPPPVIPPPKP